jgi:4a-hydroxytetrahydrobiopterin dehydratase
MNLHEKHCVPCGKGTPSLLDAQEDKYFEHLSGWRMVRVGTHRLTKDFKFESYMDGVAFAKKAAEIADAEGHHPDILLSYKRIVIDVFTHAVAGLSVNDFILAAKIDRIKQPGLL